MRNQFEKRLAIVNSVKTKQAMKKSYTPIIKLASSKNRNYTQVPNYLLPMQLGRYPADNAITFERWYMENWNVKDECERIYLPIQWTALYCNNGYGNQAILHTIQKFIDTLDTTKKYYTIVQYDDGILNDISKLDIKVIACSVPGDFNIPLLCTPHKFNFTPSAFKKDIYATFIGSLTHPVRAQIIDELEFKDGYYVTTKHHDLREYCKIMARSKYVLCPRGYGLSSFRIQEAIQMNAIPVYISDEFIFPYNMPTFPFGFTFEWNGKEDGCIDEALRYGDETGQDKVIKAMIEANKNLYTYAGCKNEILNYLRNEPQTHNMEGHTAI
jgi:hypothetical protein